MSGSLELSREGRLARLALNRAEKRNALDSALCRDLVAALRELDADRGTGAILLEGRGQVFCAGMDLDEAVQPDSIEHTAIHEDLFTIGASLSKPVVAAVQGAALGGGIGLVANAHVVVAAQGTQFGLTEIRLGLWPLFIYRSVVAAIGDRRTLELSLTGRIFSAQEALQYGLIHQVAPAMEFEDRALNLAMMLAQASSEAVSQGMEFARRTRGMEWKPAGEIALEYRRRSFASADFREGVRAFKEKRRPEWPSIR